MAKKMDSRENSGIERRTHPRCMMSSGIARCTVNGRVIHGQAMNLSRGGIFIATDEALERGAIAEVKFSLPNDKGRFYACKAEVVWIRHQAGGGFLPGGVGMKFLDLPEIDAEVIDRWVEQEVARGNEAVD